MMTYAILGFTLVSLPFIVLFILMCRTVGLKTTLMGFGFSILVTSILYLGTHFLVLAGILKP